MAELREKVVVALLPPPHEASDEAVAEMPPPVDPVVLPSNDVVVVVAVGVGGHDTLELLPTYTAPPCTLAILKAKNAAPGEGGAIGHTR